MVDILLGMYILFDPAPLAWITSLGNIYCTFTLCGWKNYLFDYISLQIFFINFYYMQNPEVVEAIGSFHWAPYALIQDHNSFTQHKTVEFNMYTIVVQQTWNCWRNTEQGPYWIWLELHLHIINSNISCVLLSMVSISHFFEDLIWLT